LSILAQLEGFQNPALTETINRVPVSPTYIGQRFLPLVPTYDLDFFETSILERLDMAPLVDPSAELPLTDRDGGKKVAGEVADMGQQVIVTKKELRALKSNNPAERQLMEAQLLGKAVTLKKNVDARIEWMRWQALGIGAMAYVGNKLKLSIDFGVPADNKVTPATKWDQNGATIFSNYVAWVEAYKALNGVPPTAAVTSSTVINKMKADVTVRLNIKGSSDMLVTTAELNQFLRDEGLPPVEAYDEAAIIRNPNDGSRTTSRFLDAKKLVFLREGGDIGQQLLGPTLENDMNPGVFGKTIATEIPVTMEIIRVVASSIPKIMVPEMIMIATVLT